MHAASLGISTAKVEQWYQDRKAAHTQLGHFIDRLMSNPEELDRFIAQTTPSAAPSVPKA